MGTITYLMGDVTNPDIKEKNGGIICHVNNDENRWGSGVVMAISGKWKNTKEEYHKILPENRKVGNVQFVLVDETKSLYVANMIAQNGTGHNEYGVPAVNYAAIEVTLNKAAEMAGSMNVDLHLPRIGCSLAGCSWQIVELIINRVLRNHKCNVYVYDFKSGDFNP